MEQLVPLLARGDAASLIQACTEYELTCANCEPPPNVYICLLLAYCAVGDFDNALLTWRRVPDSERTAQVAAVWQVGQRLRAREYAEAYAALRGLHGYLHSDYEPLLHSLRSALDAKVLALIFRGYSSIKVDRAAAMLGISEEDVRRVARETGMTEDPSSDVLYIPATRCASDYGAAGDQLGTLAQCVAQLER